MVLYVREVARIAVLLIPENNPQRKLIHAIYFLLLYVKTVRLN